MQPGLLWPLHRPSRNLGGQGGGGIVAFEAAVADTHWGTSMGQPREHMRPGLLWPLHRPSRNLGGGRGAGRREGGREEGREEGRRDVWLLWLESGSSTRSSSSSSSSNSSSNSSSSSSSNSSSSSSSSGARAVQRPSAAQASVHRYLRDPSL
ncbi:unnamed protein product [Closterium sp. NIES-54]